MRFDLRDHLILLTIGGSRAYGTNTPTSDLDVKGVCIPPVRVYRLGVLDSFEQADSPEHIRALIPLLSKEERGITPLEGVVYDLGKFCSLALKANPNILEVLFCEDSDIRFITPAGERLRSIKDSFLSKKARWSYEGYAYAQMKRIRQHRSWLLNPPAKEPSREDFGLPQEHSLLSDDEQHAFLWVLAEILREKIGYFRLSRTTREELEENLDLYATLQGGIPLEVWPTIGQITGAPPHFIEAMMRERRYRSARKHWKSYLHWKEQRNPARAELERKCLYDSKHASHLVRLYIQGLEILQKGTLTVRLSGGERDFVLWVREGNMKFEDLEQWFEDYKEKVKAAEEKSLIPHDPNRTIVNNLVMELQEEQLQCS